MKLSDITPEFLGQEATQQDVDEFVAVALEIAEREELDVDTAAEILWGDGDYRVNAAWMGISWPGS